MAMTKNTGALIAGPSGGLVSWLAWGAIGPAAVALPVNWAADKLAGAAVDWFKRFRKTDDLSRMVKTATGTSIDLNGAEFKDLRKLLAKEETWSLLAGSEVKDLADRIAACLPARIGRTTEDSREAAGTIACGLLEFAVFALEPENFQKVVLARLQQMTDQASALDKALYDLHSDLYARVDGTTDLLKRMLEGLPRGPAGHGEITIYLKTLIDWLGTDPWPRDPQFDGPVLKPAAIERKLRVTVTGQVRGENLDADALAQQCRRLVILGGPGSGKTWLAKRMARRRAEEALQALAAGEALDEVDLPLYTTCSLLFGAGGNIREAIVSSALDQLPDLGGSRISDALCVFFTERCGPTLLVIDSLDEADGSSKRLQQASNLPWRIVLTSRPGWWKNQLTIDGTDESHRVGEIQPLRFPEDVVPFIERWFAGQPERGWDLAAQIALRPSLWQAATVPLILAFYCILGSSEPLPEFRRDLYIKVLNRLLTGRWRDDDDCQPDAETCLRTLRAWAWSGAAKHPDTHVGTWVDDIPVAHGRLDQADQDAVDHVAVPQPRSSADLDNGKTRRRFIHRSIRGHLAAEYVVSLDVDLAAEALLPHIWYDPDWEYAAPAALVMHSKHDELLRNLLCRLARSDQIPTDLSVIEAGWEFRRFLAKVASESREEDWSTEIAGIIGQALVELARSAHTQDDLGRPLHWGTSNRQARDELLGLLADQPGRERAEVLVSWVVLLAVAAEDKRQARDTLLGLLGLLADQVKRGLTQVLVGGVVHLAALAEDKRQARDTLLGLLAEPDNWTSVRALVEGLVQLDPTAEDKQQARNTLLGLLADGNGTASTLTAAMVHLDPTAEDKQQARDILLADHFEDATAKDPFFLDRMLVPHVVQLDPTAEEKHRVADALLGLLAGQRHHTSVERLVNGIVQLDLTAEDKQQARDALLARLAGEADGRAATDLVNGIVQLAPTAEDMRRAWDALLGLLADQANCLLASALAGGMVKLDPTADDKHQARHTLLALLAEDDGWMASTLVEAMVQLDPTTEDKHQARDILLALLTDETIRKRVKAPVDRKTVKALIKAMVQLDPTADDKQHARDALLALLAEGGYWTDSTLVEAMVQLDPTTEDKHQARDTLLALLAGEAHDWVATELADGLVQLDPTTEDKQQARDALLARLTGEAHGRWASMMVKRVVQLDPTAEDKQHARDALLALLAGESHDCVPTELVDGLVQLDPTAEDKHQARDALLARLADQTDDRTSRGLVRGVAKLDPTVRDLSAWRAWAIPPTVELLTEARQNSALDAWLTALPWLPSPSG